MKQLISILFLFLLSGCQIDPYTHAPTWTGTDWYDAGIQDAISGYAVKDNETLADNFNDPEVDRTKYLKGYAEGQTFPPSCDTVENIDQLHDAWNKGANEGAASIRLN